MTNGRWDGMGDRAGYEAWFRERADLKVFRDLDVEPDVWKTPAGTLCTACMWETMVPGNSVEPLEGRLETMCSRCGDPTNTRGDLLLARARAFVEAAERGGLGTGDTGSDDGPYDATGYAAIWVDSPVKEGPLFRLAEEHSFGIEGDNEWGYAEEHSRLFYFQPAEEPGTLTGAEAMLAGYGWKE